MTSLEIMRAHALFAGCYMSSGRWICQHSLSIVSRRQYHKILLFRSAFLELCFVLFQYWRLESVLDCTESLAEQNIGTISSVVL